MLLLKQNQLKWEKPEWILFVATFCILILYPLMNGFPFIQPDSWTYANGGCPNASRSPVLGCAMRPVIVLGGLWGYVVVQSAVTTFLLVFLSNIILKRNYKHTFYISLLTSAVGLFSGYLMADIWTLLGLICIFSISIGYSYPIIALLLAISYSVHHGNFPVFTATALLFLPFVRCREKYVAIIFSCILGGIVLILVANLFGGQFRIVSSAGSFSFPASRILMDIPEVIDKKCLNDPEFKLCEIKEEIHRWRIHKGHQYLTWSGRRQLNISWKEFNDLSKEVVFYSLKGFFVEHLLALVRNTYGLLFTPKLASGFQVYSPSSGLVQGFERFFPDDLDDYEKSWQGSGKLENGLKKLDMPLCNLFGIFFMICLTYIGFYWRNRHEDVIVKLLIFAVIAAFLNAFFMSNLSGTSGRYQTRIGFLLIFPGFIIISRLADRLKKRIIFYLKKEKS